MPAASGRRRNSANVVAVLISAIALAVMALAAPSAAGAAPRTIHGLLKVTVAAPKTTKLGSPDGAGGVAMRVRTPSCSRRKPLTIVVRVGRVRIGTARVRGGDWRDVRLTHPLPAGVHRVTLSVRGHRSCDRATVDDLSLLRPTGPGARRPGATAAPATPATPLGPKRALPLGTAVSSGIAWRLDRPLDQTFLGRFDSLTPENAMKMTYVMPQRDQFDFDEPDLVVDYAQRYGKQARGHTLVWHEQLPGWLTRRSWSPAELTSVLHDWIGTTVGRYRGRLADWDVVNEPFDAGGNWRKSVWFTTLGAQFVEQALRLARAADPGARLFINEFDVEAPGPKQDALYALVRDLKARGVPLDGIGIQAHWSAVGNHEIVPEATLLATFRRFAALGLHVQITEMDVTIDHAPDALARQAEAFARAGRVCQSVSSCDRVTVWGVSDRDSWRGPMNRPLLFDEDFGEKPAYAALRGALAAG